MCQYCSIETLGVGVPKLMKTCASWLSCLAMVCHTVVLSLHEAICFYWTIYLCSNNVYVDRSITQDLLHYFTFTTLNNNCKTNTILSNYGHRNTFWCFCWINSSWVALHFILLLMLLMQDLFQFPFARCFY